LYRKNLIPRYESVTAPQQTKQANIETLTLPSCAVLHAATWQRMSAAASAQCPVDCVVANDPGVSYKGGRQCRQPEQAMQSTSQCMQTARQRQPSDRPYRHHLHENFSLKWMLLQLIMHARVQQWSTSTMGDQYPSFSGLMRRT